MAWVLKYTTKEFRELPIDTIRECIEGEPEIAKIPVHLGHIPEAITEYSITPKNIYGNFKGKARYDLMSVINVCLGEEKQENKLLGMLSTLFSLNLRPEEKEAILQGYGIETTKQLEEGMENMCNLGDLIEEKGIEQGMQALVNC